MGCHKMGRYGRPQSGIMVGLSQAANFPAHRRKDLENALRSLIQSTTSKMASLLESVFNHVVLPPKLPGCRDPNDQAVGDNLQTRLLGACEALRALPGQRAHRCWRFVRQQLLICLDLHRCRFDRASIRRAFSSLSVDCPVVLYIEEQNCAILVRLLPR